MATREITTEGPVVTDFQPDASMASPLYSEPNDINLATAKEPAVLTETYTESDISDALMTTEASKTKLVTEGDTDIPVVVPSPWNSTGKLSMINSQLGTFSLSLQFAIHFSGHMSDGHLQMFDTS